jgi:muconate cycloisomerase
MLLARGQACHVFSLKVAKHGGLLRTRQVAAVADAADIGWYGGTMLETSIGSAAAAHLFSTLGTQHHGCELFGPQLLVDDIVTERMAIRDFELQLPDGPGFGVEVDMAQLDRFDRARTGLNSVANASPTSQRTRTTLATRHSSPSSSVALRSTRYPAHHQSRTE